MTAGERAAAAGQHHDLKTHPSHFRGLWDRSKHHEVRRDDRNFNEGDTIVLREWLPDRKVYTGRWVRGVIGHVTGPGWIGTNVRLPDPLCVFTFFEHSRSDDGAEPGGRA